jgi:DNA-binding IclR family transcriptional regulator
VSDAVHRHRIPVIDRMMNVLAELERRESGASISELVEALAVPRSTVYRILNSLQSHQMVHRGTGGDYRLGRRLLALAARASANNGEAELVALSQQHLDGLSSLLGESCKLSVFDHGEVLVLAAAQGRRQYALSVTPGQRMPPHAGAAAKIILAHLPEPELRGVMARPLESVTPRTFTDPRRLASELARVRRQGWAHDRGESSISIHAFAAPIFNHRGRVVGAISVPFLADTEEARTEVIRIAVIEAAKALSAELSEAP